MRKTGILLIAIGLGMANPLYAGEIMEADKLSSAQLQQALDAAPDDAVIEFHGQRKTKAELRSEFLAQHKPPNPASARQLADERKAKFAAAAKALQDAQDNANAKQNALVDKEFEALSSQ
jgi:hypothetical protein